MSARHGDVYFSAADGLAESRHVFLAGNGLPDAWLRRRVFIVGETGFGTGLNFLATWHLWRRTASAGARLHFLSVEACPLAPGDLARAHRPFTELAPLAERLRAFYPHLYTGFHRIHFDEDRVTLTLLFGEAGDMLDALDARVDAWFLDGFSPARNPDLWREEVLARIGELTRPGGTAATFTAAGTVRRGLETAGFDVEKVRGYGRKRHMLRARRMAAPPAPDTDVPETVLIAGAGLAGASAAHALARRGIAVTLIDPDPELAQAASGNPAGLAAPRPTADASAAGRFHCAAFDYAERHVLHSAPGGFDPCGVLELAVDARALRRHEALAPGRVLPESVMRALSAEEAGQVAGIALPAPGILYSRAGVVRPAACARWLRESAEMRPGRVMRLAHSDRGWRAELENGERLSAAAAVLACGMGVAAFPETAPIPVTASRGQLSLAPASPASTLLRTALSFGRTISPAVNGRHLLGATYDDTDWPPPADALLVRQEDNDRNYAALKEALPDFPLPPPGPDWDARVAFRCTTPDRLPLCGPVPEIPSAASAEAPLPTGRQFLMLYKDGLYLYAGLGSRGLTTAPLLGELLASLVSGEPLPTERVVTELLHPERFFIRPLRKTGILRRR